MIRHLIAKRTFRCIRVVAMAILLCINVVIILLLSAGTFSFYKKSLVSEIAAARSDVLRQVSERVYQFKTNIHTLQISITRILVFSRWHLRWMKKTRTVFLSIWMVSQTSFRSPSTR